MRPGRGAAIGVVSELVDVEAPLCIRVIALDVPAHRRRTRLAVLLKGDGSFDIRVAS